MGIANCNFVVGICKQSVVKVNIKTPWKTDKVICFESHENEGESGIVYNGEVRKEGRGIQKG